METALTWLIWLAIPCLGLLTLMLANLLLQLGNKYEAQAKAVDVDVKRRLG